ncbi:hypothetical protein O3M35_001724 [Rhynocoris fuscipes]|uniref:Uncharacterized protein n=1 Tax=Rhynocoris fuscipes TaxID=488301 RepID=A0AAW1CNI0_9HEMI
MGRQFVNNSKPSEYDMYFPFFTVLQVNIIKFNLQFIIIIIVTNCIIIYLISFFSFASILVG